MANVSLFHVPEACVEHFNSVPVIVAIAFQTPGVKASVGGLLLVVRTSRTAIPMTTAPLPHGVRCKPAARQTSAWKFAIRNCSPVLRLWRVLLQERRQ